MKNSGGIFEIDRLRDEATKLDKETQDPDFWDDNQKAQSTLKKLTRIKRTISDWELLKKEIDDTGELLALAESDEAMQEELTSQAGALARELDDFEFQSFLSNEEDSQDAILSIHPGAGGTESQDWASMLLRMYLRWAERHGFQTETMDYQSGEEAGIKSAMIEIKGPYAYGYLKSESGVHRLVRISPFDANKRRHTSFASVFVYPETDEDINID